MNDIYISVITPCYNGEAFIENAIESVLSQPCAEQLEMIIVDDGSIDLSGEICQKYNNSIVKYYHTENKGAGHARNYGICRATGVWTMFLDADDMLLKGSINKNFFNKLKEYEKEGKEIIYGSKIKCDMYLEKSYEIWLPEKEEEILHIPRLEFWTGIYLTEFLQQKSIRFFEYREQDIESAFRFRVREYTNKTVADKNVFFILQRDNPLSNTHTWKEYVLHRVKALVYGKLFEENTNPRENEWLISITIDEITKYYECCLETGIVKKRENKEINRLLSRLIHNKNYKSRNTREMIIKAKQLKRKLLFVADKSKDVSEQKNEDLTNEVVKTNNNLYSRWKKVSEMVLSGQLKERGMFCD